MPIPSLPLEIVDLVLSHLGSDLDELTRREHGITLALVCRAWKPLAEQMMVRDLELLPGDDNGYIRHLLGRPEILRHCRRLEVLQYGREAGEAQGEGALHAISRDDGPLYVDLVRLATLVESLTLPATPPRLDLLARVANAPMAATLRQLEVGILNFHHFDTHKMVNSLLCFRGLDELSVRVGYLGREMVGYQGPAVASRLPVSRFGLHIFAEVITGLHSGLARSFHSVLEPTTLKRCDLDEWTGDRGFLDCLPQYPNLECLTITTLGAEGIAIRLETLCEVLPRLLALASLTIMTSSVIDLPPLAEHVSPISCFDFLASLPTSFKRGLLAGVFFEHDSKVPPCDVPCRTEFTESSPTLLGFMVDGRNEEDGSAVVVREEFACITDQDGAQQWRLLETVRNQSPSSPEKVSPISVFC
ncbi:hypothetical protein JCM11641_001444 [Rhodosporidiobolus odoratus]